MERSLAGLLARPLGLGVAKPRAARGRGRARASSSARRAPARRNHRQAPPLVALAAEHTAALRHALGDRAAELWAGRRTRLALIAAAAAVVVAGGGYLLVRKTPLSAVTHVRITGVRGSESRAIQAALERSAHGMSTLGVDTGALRAAVAPFRVVSGLRVSAGFPHSLSIAVVEQPAVAAVTAAGGRTAVAADGMVLGPALLTGSLPTLQAPSVPVAGQIVSDGATREALTVLGAAPRIIARHVARVYVSNRGLTVAMQNGLLVYFGDASLSHAKWRSLAAVLADPSSAGARYVDVRVPSRPAAGFGPGGAPPVPAGSTGDAGGGSLAGSRQARVDQLAQALAGATGVTEGRATGEEKSSESGEKSSEGNSEKSSESGAEATRGAEAESSHSSESAALGEAESTGH